MRLRGTSGERAPPAEVELRDPAGRTQPGPGKNVGKLAPQAPKYGNFEENGGIAGDAAPQAPPARKLKQMQRRRRCQEQKDMRPPCSVPLCFTLFCYVLLCSVLLCSVLVLSCLAWFARGV
eukprot:gene11806-biopygen21426